jgi:2-polyprenyl-3-methyl-5-hydroxy-6-metoxy-1,4-benzoquinol methylase
MSNTVKDYGWDSPTIPESIGYIAPHVLRVLADLKVRRVCDLGAGNGALVGALANAGFSAVGVEYDKQGVEIARRNYPGSRFYNLGVQDDPTPIIDAEGEGFDAVVSTEVVEHLFSPHLLPRFSRSVLRSGGYLVISTPYHGYVKNLALSVFDKWDKHHTALWHGGHIKFWSRRTLTQLLQENGFQVIGFRGAGRLPWLWKSMILVAKAV